MDKLRMNIFAEVRKIEIFIYSSKNIPYLQFYAF
jgi:hypothetical protein